MYRYTKLSLLAIAIATAGAGAYAAKANAENDVATIAQAKTSLIQAISAAEQHANGKATHADYEKSRQGNWVYDVEVVSGAKVFDVRVDADKGTVISSAEDKGDNDHDERD
ncbi:propeptide, PepSY amd peptidase M4 [Alicycliphilus sp. B1]|nr:propeptide, PepSY amd peptidase M4 [Alicycliphilus sp. B1]